MIPVLDQNAAGRIRVRIDSVKAGVSSQVIARVGLPGGCVPAWDAAARPEELVTNAAISHWEAKDGYVNLYWARGLRSPVQFDLPVRGHVPGTFRGRPSMVYPYYESDKEAYAQPIEVRINHPWAGTPGPRLPGGRGFPGRGPEGR
jgi:hypothetical protein